MQGGRDVGGGSRGGGVGIGAGIGNSSENGNPQGTGNPGGGKGNGKGNLSGSMVEEEKVLEGWLKKRGEKGAIKTWSIRWFMRKGKKLFYYPSRASTTPKGFIDLMQASAVFPFDYKGKEGYCFRVQAQRDYLLLAKTEKERDHWVDNLKRIIEGLQSAIRERTLGETNATDDSSPGSAEIHGEPPALPLSPRSMQGQLPLLPPPPLTSSTSSPSSSSSSSSTTNPASASSALASSNSAPSLSMSTQNLNQDAVPGRPPPPRPKAPPPLIPHKPLPDPLVYEAGGASIAKGEEETAVALPKSNDAGPGLSTMTRDELKAALVERMKKKPLPPSPSRPGAPPSNSTVNEVTANANSTAPDTEIAFDDPSTQVPRSQSEDSNNFRRSERPRGFVLNTDDVLASAAYEPEEAEEEWRKSRAMSIMTNSGHQHPRDSVLNSNQHASMMKQDDNLYRRSQAHGSMMMSSSSSSGTQGISGEDGLIPFSPNPPVVDAVMAKMQVHPKTLMRGERIEWAENYVCRYCSSDESARFQGCLYITNYRILFAPSLTLSTMQSKIKDAREEVHIPLCGVQRLSIFPMESVDLTASSRGRMAKAFQSAKKSAYSSMAFAAGAGSIASGSSSGSQSEHLLDVACKDARFYRFSFVAYSETRRKFIEAMQIHSPASVTGLFAFAFRPPKAERERYRTGFGWDVYDPRSEYKRIGFLPSESGESSRWRLSAANSDYSISRSYPQLIVLPQSFPDVNLLAVRDFRKDGRIPACVWRHPNNGAALARCSQPLVGIARQREQEDEMLLDAIREASSNSSELYVLDARPKANAMANQVGKGAGYEREGVYNIKFKFLGIDNIHVMRNSFRRLLDLVHPFVPTEDPAAWHGALGAWLGHLHSILAGALEIVHILDGLRSAVVVHCSDGWDRTTQLMLDDYYRTMRGFQVLIEKEWLSFGFKFADRCGHYEIDTNAESASRKKHSSPIFHQFLECVWQLSKHYPHVFEFNEAFLIALSDQATYCLYGTFLCNNEQQRDEQSVSRKTNSFWAHANANSSRYLNPRYVQHRGPLPDCEAAVSCRSLRLWRRYYFRTNPALHPLTSS